MRSRRLQLPGPAPVGRLMEGGAHRKGPDARSQRGTPPWGRALSAPHPDLVRPDRNCGPLRRSRPPAIPSWAAASCTSRMSCGADCSCSARRSSSPLLFANRWALGTSAVLAGIGVGLFIDEVGKFLTQTNDYFFPPAAPIIYTPRSHPLDVPRVAAYAFRTAAPEGGASTGPQVDGLARLRGDAQGGAGPAAEATPTSPTSRLIDATYAGLIAAPPTCRWPSRPQPRRRLPPTW